MITDVTQSHTGHNHFLQGRKATRGLILFSFDQDKITHSSHLRRQSAAEDFALSTAMTVSATAASSVWVFWVGFTCLLARHEPTTTAPPLSIPHAHWSSHKTSRIETELCAKEIIVIPLVVRVGHFFLRGDSG